MKKRIYFILASLFVVNLQAQVIDNEGLQTFINELKALKGEHVVCESEIFGSDAHSGLLSGVMNFKINDEDIPLAGVFASDTTLYSVLAMSDDEIGYNLIQSVLYKYYNEESEDIFGIPLMAWQRIDGEEEILFMDGRNTLLIRDDGCDEILVSFANYNLMDAIKRGLHNIIKEVNEEYVDVEVFGGMDFSINTTNAAVQNKNPKSVYAPRANSDEIIAFARKIYDDRLLNIEGLLAKTDSAEKKSEIIGIIAQLKEEKDERLADIELKLEELNEPSFIEIIPSSDEHYVAIPQVPAHLKAKVKPYAANGIYDWINQQKSFRAGAAMGNIDIISCIITPRDVARECVIRHYPRNKWYNEGFTAEYKELAAVEYQGCTPAILYCFSHTEKGYNDMLSDFNDFFFRKTGEKIQGLEVTMCSENNGKRFVQLWGEGGILMCLYDSPAEKYCHISIIVGGVSGFEQALNEYCFGGEKDFAKRYNIVIDSDLSNNSYGMHFVNEEYFYAGRSHKNGVHIDFGYAKRLTE